MKPKAGNPLLVTSSHWNQVLAEQRLLHHDRKSLQLKSHKCFLLLQIETLDVMTDVVDSPNPGEHLVAGMQMSKSDSLYRGSFGKLSRRIPPRRFRCAGMELDE